MPEKRTSLPRLLRLAFFAALFALTFRTFIAGIYIVPSSSMVPTLLIGDYIIATKYTYGYSGFGTFAGFTHSEGRWGGRLPRRGEVIVFRSPADNLTLVKRVIGLPGDKIQMIKGELYINEAVVPREKLPVPLAFPGDDESGDDVVDYIEYLPGTNPHVIRTIRGLEDATPLDNTPLITVPPHCYFFMGDNRDQSDDSRVPDLGPVPEENLTGKAQVTIFSMSPDAHIWEYTKWNWAMRWRRWFAEII